MTWLRQNIPEKYIKTACNFSLLKKNIIRKKVYVCKLMFSIEFFFKSNLYIVIRT